MMHTAKTNEQLVDELAAARARIAELEAAPRTSEGADAARLDDVACVLWHADVVDVDGELDWTITVLNPDAAQRLLPLDLAPGQLWQDAELVARVPSNDAEMEKTAENALRAGAERYSQECECVDRDGITRWFHEDVTVRPGSPGEWRLSGVSVDITEQKRVEQELRAGEEHRRTLQSVLDCAADGIVVVDASGAFTEFNATAEAMLGIGALESSPEQWSAHYGIYAPDTTTPLTADEYPLVQALGGAHVDAHLAFIRNPQRPDGLWLSTSARPLIGADGAIEGAVATFQDITEQRRAHAELARNEARLREAQRVGRIGSWEWDIESGEMHWSEEMYLMHGSQRRAPNSDAPGILLDVTHPDDLDSVTQAVQRALQDRAPLDTQSRLVLPTGEIRHVHTRAAIECDASGAPVRMLGTTHDVTELKQVETALGEQLRLQEREQQIARRLYELTDISVVVSAVFEELRELFDADRGMVCLADEDGTLAEEFVAFGFVGDVTSQTTVSEDPGGDIRRVLSTGEPLCDVVRREDSYRPGSMVRVYDLNGPYCILPLRVRGRTIGALALLRQEEDGPREGFSSQGVERMSPLVTDLALAVDNARLYEQVREQARSLEHVVSAARCLLWVGDVQRSGEDTHWNVVPLSEEAADAVLPVDVRPGEPWHYAAARARLPEDSEAMNVTAGSAFRAGDRSYSQDYRAIDRHGGTRWLHEDVHLEQREPGRWRVIGVTTDVTEQREAEEELRQSEQHLRRIFDHGPMGMAIVAPTLALLDVNDTLCEMLGYSRDEMLRLSTRDVTHPDDVQSDMGLGRQVLAGDIPSFSVEQRFIRKDGDVMWGRLTGAAVHDSEGGTLWGIAMVEDITDRKQGELQREAMYDITEAVHTAPSIEAMYRSIYTSLAALIDAPEFVILLAEPDDPDLFDVVYQVANNAEHPAHLVALPHSRASRVAGTRMPLCLTRGESEEMQRSGELDLRGADPSAWLGVPLVVGDELIGVAAALHWDEEAPYGERDVEIMAHVGQQIAIAIDRRRTQEALSTEQALFQALMDASEDAIYFKDTDHRFTRISRSLADGLNMADPLEAVGMTDYDLCPVDRADAFQREEREILDTGQPMLDSLVHHVGDGEDAWALISKVPTRDAKGRITGLVGINRMVTDLLRAQEALRESEMRRTQLMERVLTVQEEERARIARELHDQVGQELTSVLLGLRVVGAATSVEDARRQAEELRDVTAGTLEDVRKIAFEMRPSSLDDLGIGPALERDLAIMSQGAGFTPTLRVFNPDELPLPTALELGIYRIVHTALTNVVRHARAESVDVTLQVSVEDVSVLVQDDGVGFEDGAVLSGPVEGRFGLLFMEERARALGGAVSVDSEPGGGTTVLVQIPREPLAADR